MTFPVSMQGESMVSGEYTAKILVKGDNGINENWIEDFTITKEEADKYNERDIGLYEEKTTN
ncbi:WxL protein host-binding domain-containing protein [Enterococcus sp. LJL99]